MSVFLYYFPGLDHRHLQPDHVRAAGLADVFRDVLRPREFDRWLAKLNVAKGPDGSSGALAAIQPANGESPTVGYYPDRQTWIAIPGDDGKPRYWLGFDRDERPRPETLRRTRLVSGYEYELGDGHVWECPVIRRPGNRPNVPRVWGVDPQGAFRESVEPDYELFWDLSGEMLDVLFGAKEWERPQTFAAAAACLGLNYRVGPHELTALGVLTSDNYARVFKAAVDGEVLEEFFDSPAGRELLAGLFGEPADPDQAEKKSVSPPGGPDGTSSTPGPPDCCPTIAPPAASCSSSRTATAVKIPSP